MVKNNILFDKIKMINRHSKSENSVYNIERVMPLFYMVATNDLLKKN